MAVLATQTGTGFTVTATDVLAGGSPNGPSGVALVTAAARPSAKSDAATRPTANRLSWAAWAAITARVGAYVAGLSAANGALVQSYGPPVEFEPDSQRVTVRTIAADAPTMVTNLATDLAGAGMVVAT